MIKGIPAGQGIAIGQAVVINKENTIVRETDISDYKVKQEIERFRKAVNKAKQEVTNLKELVEKEIGENQAKIFEAHIYVLSDKLLIDNTVKFIEDNKKNAEFALKSNIEQLIKKFSKIKDLYIKDRITDIWDVYHRTIRYLSSSKNKKYKKLSQPAILISESFTPSEVAQMDKDNILGIVSCSGARNSHTAIIARALDFPSVFGAKNATKRIKTGDIVIIDGTKGEIILSPNSKVLDKYNLRLQNYDNIEQDLLKIKDVPAETIDGKRIELGVNVELPIEVDSAINHGATSIGLLRTEYLYLNRKTLPSEEEQFNAYHMVCKKISPHYTIIRTLDIGADKPVQSISFPKEENPFLGWRSIRICLNKPHIFKAQLRAILRASAYGNVKIMFPLITTMDELDETLNILNETKIELNHKGIKFDKNISVGMMIETPAAVMIADKFAKKVDFFSIGTNDLVQFSLAVDRNNNRISHMFNPIHPGILSFIKHTVRAAHENDIWVGVCGEMASNPLGTILLLGMGVDEISVSPQSLLKIKRFIKSIGFDEVRKSVDTILKLETSKQIEDFLNHNFSSQLEEIQKKSLSGLV